MDPFLVKIGLFRTQSGSTLSNDVASRYEMLTFLDDNVCKKKNPKQTQNLSIGKFPEHKTAGEDREKKLLPFSQRSAPIFNSEGSQMDLFYSTSFRNFGQLQ